MTRIYSVPVWVCVFAFMLTAMMSYTTALAESETVDQYACDAELKTMCADIKRGHGRGIACMKRQEKVVGMPCRVLLRSKLPRINEALSVCKTDLMQYCPTIKAGGGRRFECLANVDKGLSKNCRKTLDSLPF
jgi:hypothetical protein